MSVNPTAEPIADARPDNWVDRFAPVASRPYLKLARMDRPVGTWLLLWPCWWAIALAATPGHLPNVVLLILFGLGALVMRGAGCTFNDIVDRDFDARVQRTRLRPIPSGQVTVPAAAGWMVAQAFVGLVILLLLSPTAIWLGVASLLLIAGYPFMKRFTYWPQAWLGLTFNWGALMGWAAVTDQLSPAPLLLYAGGIAWTLGYDTIYAHQDKDDDLHIGVKSTALRLGDATQKWLFGFYAAAVAGFGLAGALAGVGWIYYAGLVAMAAQFAWQAWRVRLDDAADCLAKFKSNIWAGWILFGAIVLDRLLA